MSKFIVVSTGNTWYLAEDVDGSGVSYGVINLTDYKTLKSIAETLNARDEVPALTATEGRIQALANAGLDVASIHREIESYNLYKNIEDEYHFDYYETLDGGAVISVCESLHSVDRYLDLIEEQAKYAGVL